MTHKEIISLILSASSCTEVFSDMQNWKKTYREYSKIHPDICHEDKAAEAFTKLNQFKSELETGRSYNDDAGVVKYTYNKVEIVGDAELLKHSAAIYSYLMTLSDPASQHFQKFLPESMTFESDNELIVELHHRAVPLIHLGTLPHEHVNWITSRLFEFAGWMRQIDMCHCGITPESVYVIPENHGIIVTSFYHTTKLGNRLKSVSGNFSHFYPTEVFQHKEATIDIDIALAKRSAIYLLGDISGIGVKLRKTHNEAIIDFLQSSANKEPVEVFYEYRELLKKHFDTKQFHKLLI